MWQWLVEFALIASQALCRLPLISSTGDMVMASITIRNLDEDVKTGIRKRAAGNGRSMEEEVRVILREAVGREGIPDKGLGTAIHEQFKPFGGVELELPPRGPMREMPSFD